MSKYYKKRGDQPQQQSTVVLPNARIHQIRRIENKVLVALVRDMHSDHFPPECVPKKIMEIQAAKRIWNADPRFLTQPSASNSGGGGEGDEVNGVLETDMPNVEDFIGEVDASARESHNAEKHDMLKRHETALSMRGDMLVSYQVGAQKTFYLVSGEWCTTSKTVPLHISGYVSGKSKFNAVDIVCINAHRRQEQGYGIWPAAFGRVTARDFDTMLSENRQFPPLTRQHFVTSLFRGADLAPGESDARLDVPAAAAAASSSSLAAEPRFSLNRTPAESSQMQQALNRGTEARDREYADALKRELPHAVLLARIYACRLSLTKILRAPFAELSLRLMMVNEYVVFVREYYNKDVQLAMSLVARGESPALPANLPVPPVPAPGPPAGELRNIDRLCALECITIVYMMLLYEPHVLCFRPLRKHIGEERYQPWLALLPDLSLESYRRLSMPSVRPHSIPAPPPHIPVAVDIYHSIILADVYNNANKGEFSTVKSGHMFSVFGIDERDVADSFYHQRGFTETPDTLRAPDTLGQHGSFVLPSDQRRLTRAERVLLHADRCRLAGGESSATSDEFADALRWLVEEQIVVRERHIGTGLYNAGQPFDAFQAVDLHEEQTTLVGLLVDIYRRGTEQRQINAQRLVAPVQEALYQHYAEIAKLRADWASDYLPAVIESREKRIALKLQTASLNRRNGAQAGAPAEAPPASGVLLRALALEVARVDALMRARYADLGGADDDGSERDAYADARASREYRVPGLMLGALPPAELANGRPLAPEQIACIQRILEQPIVQPVGRGGVGKSELVRYLTLCYPQQIVLTAFTGNATSELTRRTGVKAYTIHSLLFRHTRFREARIRAAAYRKHSAKKKAQAFGGGGAASHTPVEHFTLADVTSCTDDYVLRSYLEEHIGGVPPFASPFPRGGMILVIDEMSLVSFKLFYRLLRAAHCPAEGRFIAKLVLMGDLDQLPSVDFGNVQSDIAHGFPESVHELVVNHRSEGTELFALAQAIAEHQRVLPMPEFDISRARTALTGATALRPPLIAFQCGECDVESRIDYVYNNLGAFEVSANGERTTLRGIQTIALTNQEIDAANETIRWSLYGKAMSGEPEQAVRLIRRARVGDEDGDEVARRAEEDLRQLLATRVMVGDRIFLTRNQRIEYPPTSRDPVTREKLFFNSRLLEAVQFYNSPTRILPQTWCRCQMCPDRDDTMPDSYISPCLRRRDLVPPERRGLDLPESFPFQFHNERANYMGNDVCRIGVFRDQSGEFIEFNVSQMLGNGAVPSRSGGFTPYARGFAMTVHKMQGAQQRIIIYLCSRSCKNFGWRAVYTAATRAQCCLLILSTAERFREFVYRLEPIRRSGLWYQLSKAIDELRGTSAERSISERWNEFEHKRYRTDVPRPAMHVDEQPAAADAVHANKRARR